MLLNRKKNPKSKQNKHLYISYVREVTEIGGRNRMVINDTYGYQHFKRNYRLRR